MSNYPIWWDTTITIYNRFEDPQTQYVRWFRNTVKKCFWKYVGDKINIGNVLLETNNIICRIPKNARFLERYEWVQVPNDEKEQYFTLGQRDIIVRGEVEDEIDEYVEGKGAQDLVIKYKALQGCMEIEQVAINVGPGRNNEHYYIRGI